MIKYIPVESSAVELKLNPAFLIRAIREIRGIIFLLCCGFRELHGFFKNDLKRNYDSN
jgi:hypothetical protein